MNILRWPIHFGKRDSVRESPLASVLPHVRRMREDCDWPPTTTPEDRDQRRERVLEARQKIVYRPLPHDIPANLEQRPRERWWVWPAICLVFFAAAVGWVARIIDQKEHERNLLRTFQYQLPSAPAFLSEDLALARAREALASCGLNTNEWKPLKMRKAGGLAPDGAREFYFARQNPNGGFFMFQPKAGAEPDRLVDVTLRGTNLECNVSSGSPTSSNTRQYQSSSPKRLR